MKDVLVKGWITLGQQFTISLLNWEQRWNFTVQCTVDKIIACELGIKATKAQISSQLLYLSTHLSYGPKWYNSSMPKVQWIKPDHTPQYSLQLRVALCCAQSPASELLHTYIKIGSLIESKQKLQAVQNKGFLLESQTPLFDLVSEHPTLSVMLLPDQ